MRFFVVVFLSSVPLAVFFSFLLLTSSLFCSIRRKKVELNSINSRAVPSFPSSFSVPVSLQARPGQRQGPAELGQRRGRVPLGHELDARVDRAPGVVRRRSRGGGEGRATTMTSLLLARSCCCRWSSALSCRCCCCCCRARQTRRTRSEAVEHCCRRCRCCCLSSKEKKK